MQLADARFQHNAATAKVTQLQAQIQELQLAVSQAVDELEAQAATSSQQKTEIEELQAKVAEHAASDLARMKHEVGINSETTPFEAAMQGPIPADYRCH